MCYKISVDGQNGAICVHILELLPQSGTKVVLSVRLKMLIQY